MERHPAGYQNPQSGYECDELGNVTGGREDRLEVVQDEQQVSLP
jgi:hypothetical protein